MVLEASPEDSVGDRMGGLETWLLINLVTIVYSHPYNKLQETHIMYGIVVLLFQML